METRHYYDRNRSSFFFPIALITVGVIWLLVNSGRVAPENIYRLLPYWPIVLVLAGVSILVGRRLWPLSLLLWTALGVAVVAAVIAPPAFLPKPTPVEVKHQVLSSPVEGVKSATVGLHLSVYPATIQALQDSNKLVNADIFSTGTPRLNVSGGERKDVQLEDNFGGNFNWWRFDQFLSGTNNPWTIGLNDSVPLDLAVDASTGSARLNLAGLKVSSMRLNASTGSMDVRLPAGQAITPLEVKCSTGSMAITIPGDTAVDMSINASTGGVTVNLPADAGVQVTVVSNGTGGLSLGPGLDKVQGDSKDKEGVYQNAAFKTSGTPIKIRLDMSTGGVTIR